MVRPDPKLVTLGMASLALANISHWLLRNGTVSEDLSDGVFGLGMGLAIGLVVLAFKCGKHPA